MKTYNLYWVDQMKSNPKFSKARFKKLDSGYPKFDIPIDLIDIVCIDEFVEIDERIPLFIGTQLGVFPKINEIEGFLKKERFVAILNKSMLSGYIAGLTIFKTNDNDFSFDFKNHKKIITFKNVPLNLESLESSKKNTPNNLNKNIISHLFINEAIKGDKHMCDLLIRANAFSFQAKNQVIISLNNPNFIIDKTPDKNNAIILRKDHQYIQTHIDLTQCESYLLMTFDEEQWGITIQTYPYYRKARFEILTQAKYIVLIQLDHWRYNMREPDFLEVDFTKIPQLLWSNHYLSHRFFKHFKLSLFKGVEYPSFGIRNSMTSWSDSFDEFMNNTIGNIPCFISIDDKLYPSITNENFFEQDRIIAVFEKSTYSNDYTGMGIYRSRKGLPIIKLNDNSEIVRFYNKYNLNEDTNIARSAYNQYIDRQDFNGIEYFERERDEEVFVFSF